MIVTVDRLFAAHGTDIEALLEPLGIQRNGRSDEEYRRAAFNPVERRQRAKCEECDGLGVWGHNSEHREVECPACDGTGVEP